MNAPLSCVVVSDDHAQTAQSIATAKAHGLGPFSQIIEQPHEDDGSHAARHNVGVDAAHANGAQWLLFVAPGETLRPDAFVMAEPALRVYDAVWGAASLYDGEVEIERVIRKSRLACQSYEEFFHLALRWWIGKSHFIKTNIAAQHMNIVNAELWWMEHIVHLWKNHRCLKTAHPLTTVRLALPNLSEPEREFLLRHLEEHPVYRSIHGTYKLPYTGRNPVIEREQTRGLFYEEDELTYLASRIPPSSVIVDVGANTGNHTVYFALFMAAQKVIPIEPTPQAVTALKRAVAINGLDSVDFSKLGIGAGREAGVYSLEVSAEGGLGATRLKADTDGDVRVAPLDELIDEPIDVIKIDVESMEMSVLEGARRLVAEFRPLVYIEIADTNTEAFLSWIDDFDYRIEKIYPDKSHANYLISPIEIAGEHNA